MTFPGDQYSHVVKKHLELWYNSNYKTMQLLLSARISANNRQNPNRKLLIDIYDDIMQDPFLYAIAQNRVFNTIGQPWVITDDQGIRLDDETRLMQTSWFRDVMTYIAEARLYGYSLIEIPDPVKGEIKGVELINRQNVSFARKEILTRPYDVAGDSITQKSIRDNYLLVDGKLGLGLLNIVAASAMRKKFALSSWIDGAERYSTPFMVASTDVTDLERIESLRKQFINAGSDRVMLTGDNDKVQAIHTPIDFNIFKSLADLENGDIATGILGQTMTTMSGSSYSQSQTHQATEDQVTSADQFFLTTVINDELIPRLINLGYDLEGCKFAFDASKEISMEDQRANLALLLQHYKVDPDTIKNVFGLDVEPKDSTNV